MLLVTSNKYLLYITVNKWFTLSSDAELNEKIIEQLKGALHEQEATMETQDVVIRNHEDEISSLVKGKSYILQTYIQSRLWIPIFLPPREMPNGRLKPT